MPFLFAAAQEAAASSTPDGSLCEPHLDPNLALFPNTSKQKKKLRKGIWCISRSFQTAVGLQKEIMPTSKRPVKKQNNQIFPWLRKPNWNKHGSFFPLTICEDF